LHRLKIRRLKKFARGKKTFAQAKKVLHRLKIVSLQMIMKISFAIKFIIFFRSFWFHFTRRLVREAATHVKQQQLEKITHHRKCRIGVPRRRARKHDALQRTATKDKPSTLATHKRKNTGGNSLVLNKKKCTACPHENGRKHKNNRPNKQRSVIETGRTRDRHGSTNKNEAPERQTKQ
jgi:hypothetical protein